jgi:hypothetical protein
MIKAWPKISTMLIMLLLSSLNILLGKLPPQIHYTFTFSWTSKVYLWLLTALLSIWIGLGIVLCSAMHSSLHLFWCSYTCLLLYPLDWWKSCFARICGGPMDNCNLCCWRGDDQHIHKYKEHVPYSAKCLEGPSLTPCTSNIWLYCLPSKLWGSMYTDIWFMGWTTSASCVGSVVKTIYQTGNCSFSCSHLFPIHDMGGITMHLHCIIQQ